MPSALAADDWSDIDDWWGSYRATPSSTFAPAQMRSVTARERREDWSVIDGLWTGFRTDYAQRFVKSHQLAVLDRSPADEWSIVDTLWEGYAEEQLPELNHLQDLMASVRERWRGGASQFDADPLTTNWRPASGYQGPLRTSIDEEDWSQWLAHLLRTSTGPFVQAMFGLPNRPPARVRREIVFSDADTGRRIDILVEYPESAVSIEVKNGDTNYRKTLETAKLIEQEMGHEWAHILLLQQANLPQLRRTFDDDEMTTERARPTIQTETYPPVDVRYWQDVSHTLRRMLDGGHEPDSHWRASAYLFITLIEQRILKLHSMEFIDSEREGGNGSPAKDLHRLVALEPERQIEYLEALLTEDTTHE